MLLAKEITFLEMKPEHIKTLQEKRPFTPFRLRLTDGSSHTVQHPELLWVTGSLLGIASGLEHPTSGVPAKAVLCDPEHVVSVEMLPRLRSKVA